jgi:hypothetical protein
MSGEKPRRERTLNRDRSLNPFFVGLVVIAGEFHPIPFRTRPLKPPAPMVLRVNTRESRSSPGQPRTDQRTIPPSHRIRKASRYDCARPFCLSGDGNGSNPLQGLSAPFVPPAVRPSVAAQSVSRTISGCGSAPCRGRPRPRSRPIFGFVPNVLVPDCRQPSAVRDRCYGLTHRR